MGSILARYAHRLFSEIFEFHGQERDGVRERKRFGLRSIEGVDTVRGCRPNLQIQSARHVPKLGWVDPLRPQARPEKGEDFRV